VVAQGTGSLRGAGHGAETAPGKSLTRIQGRVVGVRSRNWNRFGRSAGFERWRAGHSGGFCRAKPVPGSGGAYRGPFRNGGFWGLLLNGKMVNYSGVFQP
jgi:hypothetical protein